MQPTENIHRCNVLDLGYLGKKRLEYDEFNCFKDFFLLEMPSFFPDNYFFNTVSFKCDKEYFEDEQRELNLRYNTFRLRSI